MADLKEDKLRQADWAPQFSLKHMAKDLTLALGEAGQLPQPLLRRVAEIYAQGLRSGWGDEDFISLRRLL